MRFIAIDKEAVVQHLSHSLQCIREELTRTEAKLQLKFFFGGGGEVTPYHSLSLFLFLAKVPERTSLKRFLLRCPK